LEAGMGVLILDGGLIFGWTSQVFWTRDTKNRISMIKRSAPATPGDPPDIEKLVAITQK